MDVLLVGANGKTGRLVIPLLLAAGHRPRAMVRSKSQFEAMLTLGGEPVLGDLEAPLEAVVRGHDAVIFAVGSGSKTGPEKTIDVDQKGAIALMEACVAENCRRFVMLSSMATLAPERAPDKLRHYLISKAIADDHLMASALEETIVKPGYLSDDAGTGLIRTGDDLGLVVDGGFISREDTARTLVACLDRPNTIGAAFEMLAGDTPIEEALAAL
jgi:uncharacterized protein YbjT (DUF2867 family)